MGRKAVGMLEDVVSFNITMAQRPWHEALHLLETMKGKNLKPDMVTYNVIMTCCRKHEQWQRALELFPFTKGNLFCLNAALSACTTGSQWQVALSLVQASNHPLSPLSYKLAMSACNRAQQSEAALRLFEQIREKDVEICNAALLALKSLGSWQRALELLRQMEHLKIGPDVVSYTSVMKICEWLVALQIFEEMRRSHRSRPDLLCYTMAMKSCEKAMLWTRAIDFLHEMEMERLEGDVITYSTAITCCEKAGQWEQALKILTSMDREYQPGCQPNVVSFSAAISSCEKAQQWQQALSLLQYMQELQIQRNVYSYTAAITACKKVSWQFSLSLFEAMLQETIQPDRVTYNALLDSAQIETKVKRIYFQHLLPMIRSAPVRKGLVSCSSFTADMLCLTDPICLMCAICNMNV